MNCSNLFKQLNLIDENPRIDAKTASDIGNSIMETICAYANEPGMGGGYLLLGVNECDDPQENKYCIVGIENPDKIQKDLVNHCSSRFNKIIRPECFVEFLEGKTVIGVYIPEAQPGDKPIFFKKIGLPKGAYRRIGSTNQKCTDDDIQFLYLNNNNRPYDETILREATLDDLDPEAIAEYRNTREKVDPNAEELGWDDCDILGALGCIKKDNGEMRPTVAGLLLFGSKKALRKFFPMVRLDYIRVPEREWVEDPEYPFDTVEMREPLLRLILRGQATIMDDIPRAFSFTSDGLKRKEEPRIPPRVIREALVNSLMHRSYHIHGPTQVIRYANRIEITNPGHSLVPVERLGEPGSKTRNPTISAILHETKYAESKGSGIRVMRRLMEKANLSPPMFESDRECDQFTATFLLHHFLDKQDIEWLSNFRDANLSDDEARVLIHAREMGFVNNAICRYYTGLDTLGASGTLRRLRDLGLLQQHPHASATYYTPTPRLLQPGEDQDLSNLKGSVQTTLHTMSDTVPTMSDTVPTMSDTVPTMLQSAVRSLGKRSPPGQVQEVIAELCSTRPFTADELSVILKRNKKWVKRSYLAPMLRDGILEYVIPEKPRHPKQAYRKKE